jgi:hypothetical protein
VSCKRESPLRTQASPFRRVSFRSAYCGASSPTGWVAAKSHSDLVPSRSRSPDLGSVPDRDRAGRAFVLVACVHHRPDIPAPQPSPIERGGPGEHRGRAEAVGPRPSNWMTPDHAVAFSYLGPVQPVKTRSRKSLETSSRLRKSRPYWLRYNLSFASTRRTSVPDHLDVGGSSRLVRQ